MSWRPLPFFAAEAVIPPPKGPGYVAVDEGAARRRLREALAPVAGSLFRASVTVVESGIRVQVGMRPPADVLEAFESGALPAFENFAITGYRDVEIRLENALPTEAFTTIKERAVVSVAATQVDLVEAHNLRLRVPSSVEGYYQGDAHFRDRLNWILSETQAWGSRMSWVGDWQPTEKVVTEGYGTDYAVRWTNHDVDPAVKFSSPDAAIQWARENSRGREWIAVRVRDGQTMASWSPLRGMRYTVMRGDGTPVSVSVPESADVVAQVSARRGAELTRAFGRARYYSLADATDGKYWAEDLNRLGYEVRFERMIGERPEYFVPFAVSDGGST